METTPIEVLEHHVEMLENQRQQTEETNFEFRYLLTNQILKFQKAITYFFIWNTNTLNSFKT